MSDADVMLWIDLETTDADVSRCGVIEVGAFLTDMNLNPRQDDINFSRVYKPTAEGLERLFFEPVVVDMHSKSGLLSDCSRAVFGSGQFPADLINFLYHPEYCGLSEDVKIQIAGSGVASFDKPILDRVLRGYSVSDSFIYACYDVGHLRRIAAGTDAVSLKSLGSSKESIKHRAYDDIMDHYAEAKRYREWMNWAENAFILASSIHASDLTKDKTLNKASAGIANYYDEVRGHSLD